MEKQVQSRATWIILAVLIVAELTSAFESSMIYAALSTLYKVYGDPIKVGWLITSFLLVSAASAALVGRLGDIYGRRQLLMWMLLFAGAGSLISAMASSLGWVIFGRAVQGTAAAILPLCYGLVRERMPAAGIPLGVGIVAGTAAAGAALGYVAGGAIVDHLPWQSLFYFSAAMAAVGLVLVWWLLPPSPRSSASRELDVAGGILFVPAISGLLFAITKSKEWGWIDPRTLSLIALSAAVFAYWVRHELRHSNPLINVRLLADRQIALANLGFGFAAFGAFQSQMIILPLMQQPEWTLVGLGATATLAGALKGGSSMAGVAAAPWSGYICGKRGGRFAMLCGTGLLTAVWTILTFYHSSLWFVALAGVFSIASMSVIYAAVPNLILEAAPADRASETTGLSSVVRAVFGAVGAQAIAFALASSTMTASGMGTYPTEHAYFLAFSVIAVASALCMVLSYLLPRRAKSVSAARPAGLAGAARQSN